MTRMIHLDNRCDHNAVMARLCAQAADGLSRQLTLTKDPKKLEALRLRIAEHHAQAEFHAKIADLLKPRLRA